MIVSEVLDTLVGDVHITPEQIMDVNIGTYGPGDYVLTTGRKCEAELITNNMLRIFDGTMVYGGIRDVIPVNGYHDVVIENGTQGMFRNDVVVRYFKKDEVTKYGAAEFKTIRGTPSETEAEDPEVQVTDLRGGALEHSMKMYRVKLEGLNVVGVEPLFETIGSLEDFKKEVTELTSKTDLTIEEIHVNSGYLTSGLNFSKRQSDGFIRFSSLQGWSLPYGATKICDIPVGYEPAKGKRATLYFGAEAAGFLEIRDDGVYAVTSKDLNSATVYLNCDLDYWIS